MTLQDINFIASELRRITLFPRRYEAPVLGADHWREVLRRYGNAEKRIQASDCRWWVIQYKDGHEELARLRVLKNGLFSGHSPAIYRGLVLPRMVDYVTFSNVDRIRIAF